MAKTKANKPKTPKTEQPKEQDALAGAVLGSPYKRAKNIKREYILYSCIGLLILVLVIIVLASKNSNSPKASTSNDTWTGNARNDNWSSAANWTNGVPKSNDNLIFNLGTDSRGINATRSNNDLSDITFYSIKFKDDSQNSSPYQISGNDVQTSSGGVTIAGDSIVTVNKIKLMSGQSFSSAKNNFGVLRAGLDLNGNDLTINGVDVGLSSLEGSSDVSINRGELDFVSTDNSNPDFSGNVSVSPSGQLSLNLAKGSEQIGKGSLDVLNGGELLFRLNNNASFNNSITLGSSKSAHQRPIVEATSDMSAKSSTATSFTLSLAGNVTLENDALLYASSKNTGLVPVSYKLVNKPSGDFKLVPANSSVNVSTP